MNAPAALRVWRGWRLQTVGQVKFVERLAKIFIPATWQVMSKLGLECYVPSVLPESKPDSLPDEVALLFYPDRDTYLKARSESVGGRAYSLMHEALFSFAPPRASKSSDAKNWQPDRGDVTVGVPRWRHAEGDGIAFSSSVANVAFVALAHDTGDQVVPELVFAALGHHDCEAVVYSDETFTLAWLACPRPIDIRMLGASVSASVPQSQLVAANPATRSTLDLDYFAASNGVSVKADQTLYFCASDRLQGHRAEPWEAQTEATPHNLSAAF